MNLIKVEGESGIARDATSGSIVNVDTAAYEKWKAEKNKKNEIASLTNRISDMEERFVIIEDMLQKILEKL